jgi:membrane protein implicated in regulation of membrane protease activity
VPSSLPQPETKLLRLYVAVVAFAALAVLLATAWLRFLVPSRAPERVRDLTWLSSQER